jgi:pimeloyl-ACP methyl ester carboxylesterase
LKGYLIGTDDAWRLTSGFSSRECYGVLLEGAAGEFLVAIRGTNGILEWIEDAQAVRPTPHPLGGRVGDGFWGLYETLVFRPPGGTDVAPAAKGIADAIGVGGTVTVAGHSLGAALATYLTLDLAERPGIRVQGRYFASPRPGDAAFVDVFDRTVADYRSYAYALDVVPHVPLGFVPLLKSVTISPDKAQARIRFGIGCAHHLVCYLAALDYANMEKGFVASPIDVDNLLCIRGPR